MYVALMVLLLGAGGALYARGLKKHRRLPVISGGGLVLAVSLFFGLLSLWGEALWFALGQLRRFWVFLLSRLGCAMGGAAVGGLIVFLLTLGVTGPTRLRRLVPEAGGAVIGALWGLANWDVVLRYWHAVETSLRDPVLGRDTGFYLFKLPLYYNAYWLLLLLVLVALAASIPSIVERYRLLTTSTRDADETEEEARTKARAVYSPLYVPVAGLLFVLASGRYLARFRLMYSELGVVHGFGHDAP